MELIRQIRMTDERFVELKEHCLQFQLRVEELLYRAQRLASAKKTNPKSRDILFADDLQLLRRALRSFGLETSALPGLMERLQRDVEFSPSAELTDRARSLRNAAANFASSLTAVCEQMRLMHQYCSENDDRVQIWYAVQELEAMLDKVKGYPFLIANLLINRLSGDPPPAGG